MKNLKDSRGKSLINIVKCYWLGIFKENLEIDEINLVGVNMKFRDEVRRRLEGLELKIDQVLGLMAANNRLEKQNQDLFDRLMSIDWEKYASMSPTVYNRYEQDRSGESVMSPTQDESIIGEILSDEDLK